MTSYSFVKLVNSGRLLAEVRLSLPALYTETVDNVVSVWFSDPLSPENELTLTGIVDSHVPITLAEAKTARIKQVNLTTQEYILDRYPLFSIVTLNTIGVKASLDGLLNRKTYVLQFTNWFVCINAYTAAVASAISNAASLPVVAGIPFSIVANTPVDPLISISYALSIPD